MADRVIYKLTEYNSSTGEEKIIYSHIKQSLEEEMPTVSEDQEIIKAIDVERNILEKLDTHTTLDTLDHSFIDLKKFIKKCFKEYNNN